MLVVKSEIVNCKAIFEEKSVNVHGISKLEIQMCFKNECNIRTTTRDFDPYLEVTNVNEFVKQPFFVRISTVSYRNQTMYSDNNIFIVDNKNHNILSICWLQ